MKRTSLQASVARTRTTSIVAFLCLYSYWNRFCFSDALLNLSPTLPRWRVRNLYDTQNRSFRNSPIWRRPSNNSRIHIETPAMMHFSTRQRQFCDPHVPLFDNHVRSNSHKSSRLELSVLRNAHNNGEGDDNHGHSLAFSNNEEQKEKTFLHGLINGLDNVNNVDEEEETHLAFSRRKMLDCTGRLAASILMSSATVASMFRPAHAATSASFSSSYESEEARRIAIFERTSPSVVFVDTFAERRDSLTTNIMEVPLGSGSGIVWDKQGHIVTNFHVVRNAQSAQVAILLSGADAKAASKVIGSSDVSGSGDPSSGAIVRATSNTNGQRSKTAANMVRRVFIAKIVGVDPGKDIAVLKIDADPIFLFPIAVGTSQGIKVGQQAMAIGNPFGLDHTLTSGIISGTGREVRSPIGRPITDVIQTDAAINPGNSGGPLLDSSGKLIGMNTAIYSPSGASAGIGFAIPIDAVKVIVETLIRDGKVIRPVLGISYLGSKQAQTLGISAGVLVLDAPPESPAAKAGLKGTRRTGTGLIELGDIIIKVGGQMIDVEADLFSALEDLHPGDMVHVTVNRVVAVNDELQMKEIVLNIVLQASNQVEKTLQLLYQSPAPAQ